MQRKNIRGTSLLGPSSSQERAQKHLPLELTLRKWRLNHTVKCGSCSRQMLSQEWTTHASTNLLFVAVLAEQPCLTQNQMGFFLHWQSVEQAICSAGYLCILSTLCALSMYVYTRPLAYGHRTAVSAHHYLTVCFCVFMQGISTHSTRPNLFCNMLEGFSPTCYLHAHVIIHDKQVVIHDTCFQRLFSCFESFMLYYMVSIDRLMGFCPDAILLCCLCTLTNLDLSVGLQ